MVACRILEYNLGMQTYSHTMPTSSSVAQRKDALLSVLGKSHKIQTHGNPDLFDYAYATFTIDDARQIKSLL